MLQVAETTLMRCRVAWSMIPTPSPPWWLPGRNHSVQWCMPSMALAGGLKGHWLGGGGLWVSHGEMGHWRVGWAAWCWLADNWFEGGGRKVQAVSGCQVVVAGGGGMKAW